MLLEVTRPQRLAILCLAIMVNMAVCAVLLGLDVTNASHTALAGLVAAVRSSAHCTYFVCPRPIG
jgi:hypothetical protein